MANITLYNDQPASATFVPNIFIDEYMTQANGEYVKIYLYLLRNLNQSAQNFSLSAIADHFDCTERDILRALKYWEKLRLFRLEFDNEQNLAGICVLNAQNPPAPSTPAAFPATDTLKKEAVSPVQKESKTGNVTDQFIQAADTGRRTYTMDEIRNFNSRENVRELIFITEQYLGRTLTRSDLNIIFFWYDELKLPTDVIEVIIENCVAKGKSSLYYMQKVAEDFASRNIRTVKEAKTAMNQGSSLYYAVLKAFGIRGRNLVPAEQDFLNQWSDRMGFSTEVIEEACSRTIRSAHEANFAYANSILKKWHENGIRTLDDIAKSDSLYQQSQKNHPQKTAAPNNNRFINFQQRDNDYEDLQKQLLQKSMLNKKSQS